MQKNLQLPRDALERRPAAQTKVTMRIQTCFRDQNSSRSVHCYDHDATCTMPEPHKKMAKRSKH
eukprot:6489130-Amphidinium_carterae.1